MAGMLVRDAMNREALGVTPETSLACVVRLLERLGAAALPVLDAQGRPIAMVRWVDAVTCSRGCRAEDMMVPGAPTVDAGADLGETADRMAREALRRLLVVEDGRLVGMLAAMDCLRALVRDGVSDAQTSREGRNPCGPPQKGSKSP